MIRRTPREGPIITIDSRNGLKTAIPLQVILVAAGLVSDTLFEIGRTYYHPYGSQWVVVTVNSVP